MILIHPPVVKPCEPPAGLAKLAGVMYDHDIPCKVIDANLEGLSSLLLEGEEEYINTKGGSMITIAHFRKIY